MKGSCNTGGGGGSTGGAYSTIVVVHTSGATVTISPNAKMVASANERTMFHVTAMGTYVLTAVKDGLTDTKSVEVAVIGQYLSIELTCRVPAEYQAVEYIEKNSNAYIDTGVVLGSSDFEINYKIITPTSVSSSTEQPITSIWTSSPNYWHNMVVSSVMRWYLGQQINIASGLTGNTEYAVQLKRTGDDWTYNVNGTAGTAKSSYNPTVNNTTLKILVRGDLNQKADGVGMKIIYYDVSVDGTLQRKMYPCYRKSDSAVGLYDVANGVFYGSDGTGVFTAGADI